MGLFSRLLKELYKLFFYDDGQLILIRLAVLNTIGTLLSFFILSHYNEIDTSPRSILMVVYMINILIIILGIVGHIKDYGGYINIRYSLLITGYSENGIERFNLDNISQEYCEEILVGIYKQYESGSTCKDIPFKHDPEIGLRVSIIMSSNSAYTTSDFKISLSGIENCY